MKENIKQHNQQKSTDTKMENVFRFEDDKPRRDAILTCSKVFEHVADAPAVIDVDAVIAPADLSKQDCDSATDSPADNLTDVFKLILEVNDADKLRRIRDFADARINALAGKKISLQTPPQAEQKI